MMTAASEQDITVLRVMSEWWKESRRRVGTLTTASRFLRAMWEFARESTPERRRRRYGDADYDWDHRVNTTSATVNWRNRLLGIFLSPYQATEPALFQKMLDALSQARVDFRDFVFVDLGSGKGRTLLMASDYPFRRIMGVELLPALHRIAQENLAKYRSESQKCFALEAICGDATEFPFPEEPLVVYLFNPFLESGLRRVIANLQQSLRARPRAVYVLYHNPLLAHVVAASAALQKIGGTHQYSVFAARVGHN